MLQSDNKITTTKQSVDDVADDDEALGHDSHHFPFVTTRKKSEIVRTHNKDTAAPGRMSAAMARSHRGGEGDIDVFLHDVDRTVEREFTEEFLCDKF
jgi:hypothetical protein